MAVVYKKVSKTHLAPKANEWGTMEWSVFREDDYSHAVEAVIRFRDCYGKPICLDVNAGRMKNVKERIENQEQIPAGSHQLPTFA